jgi:hypothetical protein
MPRRGSLERAEMITILKEAHEECKDEVGITIGKKRLTRSRSDYLSCLKRKMREKIKKKLTDKGLKVAGEVAK